MFKRGTCSYCFDSFYKYQLIAHEKDCGDIEKECNDCHWKIKSKDYNHHKNSECKEKKTTCIYCRTIYREAYKDEVNKHNLRCRKRCQDCSQQYLLKDGHNCRRNYTNYIWGT